MWLFIIQNSDDESHAIWP